MGDFGEIKRGRLPSFLLTKKMCLFKIGYMKNIVFDMDGVIFDTEKIWAKAYDEASVKFGQNFDEKFRKYCCGRNAQSTIDIMQKKFPDVDAVEVRAFMRKFVDDTTAKNGVEIKPGFVELLEFLKTKNIKLALATGSEMHVVENYFESVGLNVYDIFDAIVSGNMVKKAKPDPEVYATACKLLEENPENCIAIEDSPNGIESAGKAGLETLFVVDQIQPDEVVFEYATKIFNNLFEVKDYFDEN